MQNPAHVVIKGVREGLLLILDDDVPFSEVLVELSALINSRPGFFDGAGIIINAARRVMDRSEFDVLYKLLTRNGMRVQTFVSLSAQSRMVAESYGVPSRPPSFAAGDAGGSLGLKGRGSRAMALDAESSSAEAGMGLFLRCSLRAGQSVRYGGDVCILGDVEPGAEVVAGGDIVVWGALLGTVHAGAAGDDEAVVCALHMEPAQLGIGGVVNRFPAREHGRAGVPEVLPELARIEDGRIVVETWRNI